MMSYPRAGLTVDKTSPAIPIGSHWMITWPFDAAANGLPTTVRDKGAYAYLHVCGSPGKATNTMRAIRQSGPCLTPVSECRRSTGSIPSGIARRRGSLMSASDHNGRRLTQRNETKTSLPIKLAPGMAAAKTCVAFSHAGVGQYGASSRPVAYMPRPKTEWSITLFSR